MLLFYFGFKSLAHLFRKTYAMEDTSTTNLTNSPNENRDPVILNDSEKTTESPSFNTPEGSNQPITLNDLLKNKEALAYLVSIAGIFMPWLSSSLAYVNGTNIGKVIMFDLGLNTSDLDRLYSNASGLLDYFRWFVLKSFQYISYYPFLLGLMIYLSFKPPYFHIHSRLKGLVSFLLLLTCLYIVVYISVLEEKSDVKNLEINIGIGFHITWIGVVVSQFYNREKRYTVGQIFKRLLYFIGGILVLLIVYSVLTQAGPVKQ